MASKLSTSVQIAEIISSVAVVATLVFLVFEIRQNSDLVRTSMFESQTNALILWRQSLAENQQNRELYFRFETSGVEPLTEQEKDHLLLILNSLWSTYEQAYLANARELLGAEEWQRFEPTTTSDKKWWPKTTRPKSATAPARPK